MLTPPRATLWLCNSPLTMDNEHQIKFNSAEEQQTYFNSLDGTQLNYNYVRNEGYMTIPLSYYDTLKYNYLVFQNTYVNGKWFFCFIEQIEFVNDRTTKLIIKTDVWQTYQFNITFKKSFIERTHIVIDEMNTLNDIPSEGELIKYRTSPENFTGAYFVFLNTDVTAIDTSSIGASRDFKLGNYTIPCQVLAYQESQASSLSFDTQLIASQGVGDRINSVVYVPFINNFEALVVENITSEITGQTIPICSGTEYPNELLKKTIELDFSDVNLGHLKALTFPYAKIVVQDLTTGQKIELDPSKFLDKKATFEIQGSISERPYYRVIPTNYKDLNYAYDDAMVIKCDTTLPTANNSYAKYLMNNGDFNNLKIIGATVGAISGVAQGSPMSSLTGFESVTNVLLQESQARKQPNQLSSISDGAMERILFQNGVVVYLYVMDLPHRDSANDFWNMFGYPVRKLDYPSFSSALDYQYIKTVNASIEGSFPQTALQEIQSIFNKGVTMWKSNRFREY